MANELDAHAKPPAKLREFYKQYQKLKTSALDDHPGLIQFDDDGRPSNDQVVLTKTAELPSELREIFLDFLGDGSSIDEGSIPINCEQRPIYQVLNMPGKNCQLSCLIPTTYF